MEKLGKVLITICARGGSKGVPSKNTRELLGKPLIVHTIEQARAWTRSSRVVVSTDSNHIANVAREAGAEVPFMRPAELATDSAGKLQSIIHGLETCEALFAEAFDLVLDLDPTCPMRSPADFESGYDAFRRSNADVCMSVVLARKNPYFNMVERDDQGRIGLVKQLDRTVVARQAAPRVYEINGAFYFLRRDFLLRKPETIWEGSLEIFEMAPEAAFDIDEERDFFITEALMRASAKGERL